MKSLCSRLPCHPAPASCDQQVPPPGVEHGLRPSQSRVPPPHSEDSQTLRTARRFAGVAQIFCRSIMTRSEGGLFPSPKRHTGDGENQSAPRHWSERPRSKKSLALVCDDPDAPVGMWVHWVLFNLPAETRELEEGASTTETLKSRALRGKDDFRRIGCGGPAPPGAESPKPAADCVQSKHAWSPLNSIRLERSGFCRPECRIAAKIAGKRITESWDRSQDSKIGVPLYAWGLNRRYFPWRLSSVS